MDSHVFVPEESRPLLGNEEVDGKDGTDGMPAEPAPPTFNSQTFLRLGCVALILAKTRVTLLAYLALVASSIFTEVAIYCLGLLTSSYFQLLLRRDLDGFVRNTGLLLALFVVIAALKLLSRCSGGIFAAEGRLIISDHLQSRFITEANLYRMVRTQPMADLIDNPDQRICSDVDRLTIGLRNLLEAVVINPLTIIFYTFMVWRVSGSWLGPALVYAYYAVTTFISFPLMRPLVSLTFRKQRAEGDFRLLHVHVRDNVEPISLERAQNAERKSLGRMLGDVISWQRHLVFKEANLAAGIAFFAYTGGILAYVIVAIPVLLTGKFDDMPPDELSKIISLQTFMCMYLSSKFSGVISQGQDISDIAGFVNRVGTLWEALDSQPADLKAGREFENSEEDDNPSHYYDEPVIQLHNATIAAPTAPPTTLLRDLSFSLTRSARIVLTGGNGLGKSSILRVLAELWPLHGGTIRFPVAPRESMLFVPQYPYIPFGSLRYLVTYPWAANSGVLSDAELVSRLEAVGLNRLAAWPLFDEEMMPQVWEKSLSPGEKQRLAFARLFYHLDRRKQRNVGPPFVILDESSSSIDPGTSKLLMERLAREHGCGWLRVSHADLADTIAGEAVWRLSENGSLEIL